MTSTPRRRAPFSIAEHVGSGGDFDRFSDDDLSELAATVVDLERRTPAQIADLRAARRPLWTVNRKALWQRELEDDESLRDAVSLMLPQHALDRHREMEACLVRNQARWRREMQQA